jgi:hypothetical protein
VIGALVVVAALAGEAPAAAPPPRPTVPLATNVVLVPFDAPESVARLERSRAKVDFFPLVMSFEPQMNQGTCGPTSAVVVLNALRLHDDRFEKPVDASAVPAGLQPPPGMDPYVHRYSQRAFFDDKLASVKPVEQFYGKPAGPGARPDPGLQLRQLGAAIAAHGADVTVRVVDDKLANDAAKQELIANLQSAGDYVVVNFHRAALGQKGGGHHSPLGAYDAASDSFLLLDVNPTGGKKWAWVKSADLIAAMRTKDAAENRGYLLVKEGAAR